MPNLNTTSSLSRTLHAGARESSRVEGPNGRIILLLGAAIFLTGVAACKQKQDATTVREQNPRSTASASWFTEITREAGIDFIHESGANGKYYMPESMASGGALLDYDNDGDLDIYLVNGHTALPELGPVDAPLNRLYRQETGGRFVDVTEASGLGDGGYGMGVAVGDIDNDGHLDVYVTNYGLDRLYRNRGDGTFQDVTDAAGIIVDSWSCSAAFVDYDRDGYLDLYVTRYVEYNPNNPCMDGAGRVDYCTPTGRLPVPDVMLRNNGDGTFADVSATTGIKAMAAAGLGVVCEDFNDDGWQDIYVANDQYANYLWINQGDGTFHDEALISGTAYNVQGMAEAGMGVVAADLDNDLDLDLWVTHFRNETNTLYRNLGRDVGFADVTAESGFGSTSVPYTGFGTDAFDVELDGDLDLVVINGAVVRGPILPGVEAPPVLAPYAEPNLFYLNDGDGGFSPLGAPASSLIDHIEVSRGLATGDIDADGDRDVLLCTLQGPARLYRNDAPDRGHWLGVRAIDPRLKRDAYGAKVFVETDDRRWMRTIGSARSYLSSGDPRAHFGLGSAQRVKRVDVHWPDGLKEQFPSTPVDHYITLQRGSGMNLP